MHNPKIQSIEKLKFFGIFLVVLGHSLPIDELVKNPQIVQLVWYIIYTFHMPLFFSISGFLFYLTTKSISYNKYVTSRIIRLLIPYFIISLIAILPRYILNQFSSKEFTLSIQSVTHSLIYPLDNPIRYYWYLPTLFNISLLTLALRRIIRESKFHLILSIGILTIIYLSGLITSRAWMISDTLYYSIYFYFGWLLALQTKTPSIHFKITGFIKILFVTTFVLTTWIYWHNISNFTIPIKSLRIISALSGLILAWILLHKLSLPNLSEIISRYSYQIFLLSIFPQVFIKVIYFNDLIPYWLCIFLMLVLGLMVPILISKIIEIKIPRLKFIIGLK